MRWIIFICFSLLMGQEFPELKWVYTYNGGQNSYDVAWQIIYAPDSNLYVCGHLYSYPDDKGIVISLTPDSIERWIYIPPQNNLNSGIYGIKYGRDGNLYALTDYFTVLSLTGNGNLRWMYTHGQWGYVIGWGYEIEYVDTLLYACGRSVNGYFDVICLSSSTGNLIWEYEDTTADEARSLEIGPDSNIYILGSAQSGLGVRLMCMSSDGSVKWVKDMSGWGYYTTSLICSPDSHLYFAMPANGALTVKCFDLDGNEVWTYIYSNANWPKAFSYGVNKKIYLFGAVTGYSWYPLRFICIDALTGYEVWKYEDFSLTGNFVSSCYNPYDGRAYFSGSLYNARDYYILRFDSIGTLDWFFNYDSGTSFDFCNCVMIAPDKNIYSCGYIDTDISGYYDIAVMCLGYPEQSVNSPSMGRENMVLSSVYISSLQKDVLRIKFLKPMKQRFILSLYGDGGRCVYKKVFSSAKGEYLLNPRISSGVYYLEIKGNERKIFKFIKF